MDTNQLKIILSKLEPFKNPDPSLEQYTTPPEIAADVLQLLNLHVEGDTIVDLGAGTGILSIGAGLLGFTVRGYDIDDDAIEIARSNCSTLNEYDLDVSFFTTPLNKIDDEADAVIMNPPFGIQDENANLDFLTTSFEIADTVFALLHQTQPNPDQTRQFIKEFASKRNYDTGILKEYAFRLPRTMSFHRREQEQIDVDLYMFRAR